MPLVKVTNISKNSAWLLWHITEDLESLFVQSKLTPFERTELEKISHPTKKKELLAGKLAMKSLVNQMGMDYHGIYKDEFGKPHLEKHKFGISISHSYPYAAASIDLFGATGIDIEKPLEKIQRISKKFLNKMELEDCANDIEELCTYWSAKEALYKLHGRKSLIFKENLKIVKKRPSGGLTGKFILSESEEVIDLGVEKINGYIICYTLPCM